MTADIEIDKDHSRFDEHDKQKTTTNMSPLGTQYSEAVDLDHNHIHLVQDSMLHDCTEYCIGESDTAGIKLRTCRFGFGTEVTSNASNTPGKE